MWVIVHANILIKIINYKYYLLKNKIVYKINNVEFVYVMRCRLKIVKC